ncbi:hypothetical protein LLG46_02335 [bacterium]|nr:hypothetical protein [bacterium]
MTTDYNPLCSYIREVADKLRLRDWEFVLKDEPPEDEDVSAEIVPIEGRKRASIYLCTGFRELSPEEQRHTIVHELLHCHLESATDIIRLDLWEHRVLSQNAYDILIGGFRRQIEYAVDAIADAIAHNFPLIEWDANTPTRG